MSCYSRLSSYGRQGEVRDRRLQKWRTLPLTRYLCTPWMLPSDKRDFSRHSIIPGRLFCKTDWPHRAAVCIVLPIQNMYTLNSNMRRTNSKCICFPSCLTVQCRDDEQPREQFPFPVTDSGGWKRRAPKFFGFDTMTDERSPLLFQRRTPLRDP